MTKRYLTAASLVVALLFMTAANTQAQDVRPDETGFVKPIIGTSLYIGDNNNDIFDFDQFDAGFPYLLGLELGYQFSVPFSLSLKYRFADYPNITQFQGDDTTPGWEDHPSTRSTISALARYTFADAQTRVAPYLQGGANVTFGETELFDEAGTETRLGFGPSVGLGVDIVLSRQVSLFFENNWHLTFGDEAADGTTDKPGYDNWGANTSFDMLTGLSTGLKINFRAAFTPVEILAVDGPEMLTPEETGTFTSTVNEEEATPPLDFNWDFGDGNTASGLLVEHEYAEPGEYTVTFTASDRRESDSETMTVNVLAPAEIVTVQADPMNPMATEEVSFSSNVQGSDPVNYEWDFGDGNTSSDENPTHTYDDEGDYTVSLNVENEAGTDQATLDLSVDPFEADYCADVTEMNSVFFDQNSSVLTDEGEQLLEENVQIFEDCPNMTGSIEGFAGPFEADPDALSEDRAQAVAEYYQDQGISIDRFDVEGMGREADAAKKDGAEEFRRVDTVPQP